MYCASCVVTIEKSLKRVSGVKDSNVNFASEKANVEYDVEKTSEKDLEKAVKEVDYEIIKIESKAGTVTLRVRGLSSQHCEELLRAV